MNTYYEKCVDELRKQLHAENQARLAFERISPDGTLTPRPDAVLEEATEDLRIFNEWRDIAKKHNDAFYAMSDDLIAEIGDAWDGCWPKEIGDLLCECVDAMPKFLRDAGDAFLLARFREVEQNA